MASSAPEGMYHRTECQVCHRIQWEPTSANDHICHRCSRSVGSLTPQTSNTRSFPAVWHTLEQNAVPIGSHEPHLIHEELPEFSPADLRFIQGGFTLAEFTGPGERWRRRRNGGWLAAHDRSWEPQDVGHVLLPPDSGQWKGSDCPICFETMLESINARMLPQCGHVFHTECIGRWLAHGRASCPMDRLEVDINVTSSPP